MAERQGWAGRGAAQSSLCWQGAVCCSTTARLSSPWGSCKVRRRIYSKETHAGGGNLCVFEDKSEDVAAVHVNLEVTLFIFFSCRVRGTNCTGIVVNWSRSPELFLNVKLQQGFPPLPLTSNMTSLSGTKERSVSSRSRKYGVGYSSEWGGHTSVICNVMSDIKSIASSTRWCAVHLAGSLISVSFLRHPWMWSFITDPRPVLTDRVVHASPLSFVFTARTPACVYYDPLRTEHTHLCLWRPPPIINHIRPTLGSTVQPLIAYL